jgi:hypothetical protein
MNISDFGFRIADCGLRTGDARCGRVFQSAFRNPQSAIPKGTTSHTTGARIASAPPHSYR